MHPAPSPRALGARGNGWLPCPPRASGTCLGKVASIFLFPGTQYILSRGLILSLRVFTFWNFQMRNELFVYQYPSQLHGKNINISPVTRCRRGPDTRFQSPGERFWSRTTSWLYLLWVKAFRSVQHLWNKRGRVWLFGHESSFPWS